MPTHAADMLTYVQELESTGLTRDQAVAIARGSANMMQQQFETLATKADIEALDTRVESLETRMDALATKIELGALEKRMDTRMDTLATKTELASLEKLMNERFEGVNRRLDKLEDLPIQMRVHTWMLAVLTIAVVVPQLQRWLAL